MKQIKIKPKKYQAGGSVEVGKAIRKNYGLDRQNNDTWLDVPQKVAMYMAGLGYRKPSDYLYANGLGDSSADELKAFIADAVFDPLNLVGVGEVRNAYKAAKVAYPVITNSIKAADKIDLIDDTYQYGKKKASEFNKWLGENTGYKFKSGGRVNKYSTGGDIAKGVGAGAYGLGEGLLDNLTLGLTDGLTDKGYQMLNNLNNDSQSQKISNIVRSSGNIVGQVGGAIATGGATTTTAISGGLKSGNDIVQNTVKDDKAKQIVGMGSNLASMGMSFAGGMNSDMTKAPKELQGIMNFSKNMKQFQSGGKVGTEDLMPHNPNYLNKISENLVQYDGPTHQSSEGGIRTNAGFMDKQETVLKPGVVGNQEPYAFSDNLKLSKETLKQLGLPSRYTNKTVAEASKSIESKYESKPGDDAMKRNTKVVMKDGLYKRLIQANELEFGKNRKENGVNSKEDMSFEELNKFQGGGWLDNIGKNTLSGGLYDANTNDYALKLNQQESIKPLRDESLDNPYNGVPYSIDNYGAGLNLMSRGNPNYAKTLNLGSPLIQPISNNNTSSKDMTKTVDDYSGSNNKSSIFTNENLGLMSTALATLGQLPGLLKKETVPTQYNPYNSRIQEMISKSKVNMQPLVNQLQNQTNAMLDRDNARSMNTQRAMNSNMLNQYTNQLSDIRMKEQDMTNGLNTRNAEILNGLGQQMSQARQYQEELQARTDAARRNGLSKLMANVGENTADYFFKNSAAEKQGEEVMAMIRATSNGEFSLNADSAKEFSKKIMSDPNYEPFKFALKTAQDNGDETSIQKLEKEIAKLKDPNLKAELKGLPMTMRKSKQAVDATDTKTK